MKPCDISDSGPVDPHSASARRRHVLRTLGRLGTVGTVGILGTVTGPALRPAAADEPRPLRIIVPYPPGGFTDMTARLVAEGLQRALGRPVQVDNRAGANGIIGADAVARSTPDGNTVGVVIAAHAANTTLYPRLPYDPQKDFAPVSLIGRSPLVLAARNDAPFRTLGELIEHARRHPGKFSYGTSGNGSAGHLCAELLQSTARIRLTHVAYKGAAAVMADLLGGQIDLCMDAASGVIAQGKAGRVRLLGVAGERRLPVVPEVPTFIEQGLADFSASTWAGVLAPARTPGAAIQKLSHAIARTVAEPDVRSRLEEMGTVPDGSTPAQFELFLASETARWSKVIRDAGVKVE